MLLIPTKMLVFDPYVQGSQRSPDFDRVVEAETEMWAATRQALATGGIDFVDALPALRRSVEEGRPYPMSQDGHPNAFGHQAIAAAVAAHLRQWQPP